MAPDGSSCEGLLAAMESLRAESRSSERLRPLLLFELLRRVMRDLPEGRLFYLNILPCFLLCFASVLALGPPVFPIGRHISKL